MCRYYYASAVRVCECKQISANEVVGATEAHLGPIKNIFLIRYNKFPNSLYRIKFVITNSRIRNNEFGEN